MGAIVLIWGCVFSFLLVAVLIGHFGIMGFMLGIFPAIAIIASIMIYQCQRGQRGPTDLRDDWPHAKKRTQRLAEFIASRFDVERGEHD